MNKEQLEETKKSLQAAVRKLDSMILKTPSGQLQDNLTDINIYVGIALINIKAELKERK